MTVFPRFGVSWCFDVWCLFLLPSPKLEPLKKPRIHGAPATQRRTWAHELRSKEHASFLPCKFSICSTSCSQLISAIFKNHSCFSTHVWVFILFIYYFIDLVGFYLQDFHWQSQANGNSWTVEFLCGEHLSGSLQLPTCRIFHGESPRLPLRQAATMAVMHSEAVGTTHCLPIMSIVAW